MLSRKGQVTVLETKQGARLPERYKVGNLLKNERRIMAYSSGKLLKNIYKYKFYILNFVL